MEINQDLNKPVDDNSIDTIQMKEPQEQRPANPEPTPQPAAPSSPATPANDNCNDTSCHKKGVHTAILACNIVLLIGLIVLYILHFTGMGSPVFQCRANGRSGCLTDTLDLFILEAAISAEFCICRDFFTAIPAESQQQATEAELNERAKKLSTLEAELTAKVMQKQMDSNIELLNRIFAFVREYNADNQQFDIIMRKTFNDSPTLYMNPAMDITNEIIEGLNKEYKSVKGKKADK